jgi:chromate transporter
MRFPCHISNTTTTTTTTIGFLVLTLSGLFLYSFIDPSNPPIWLIGVPAAAISLIFKAFYGFGQKLDHVGIGLAMISCTVAIMINGDEHIPKTSSQFVYPILLVLGGTSTLLDFSLGNGKSFGDYVRSGVCDPTVCCCYYYLKFIGSLDNQC